MTVKQKKIGTFTHQRSGITIDYFLEGTKFVCLCLEEKVSALQASILQAEVEDRLEHWMKLEWHPVIKIAVESKEGRTRYGYGSFGCEGASVELETLRFYLSRSPAGRVVFVDWDEEDVHRKAKMREYSECQEIKLTRLPLVAPLKMKSNGYVLLDYDPHMWETLEGMKQAIREIQAKITDLTSTKDGLRQLMKANGAVRLLAALEA